MTCSAARTRMPMTARLTVLGVAMLCVDITLAYAGCSCGLTDTFVSAQPLVGSLRPGKGGQECSGVIENPPQPALTPRARKRTGCGG
jgi:hypothetical protein